MLQNQGLRSCYFPTGLATISPLQDLLDLLEWGMSLSLLQAKEGHRGTQGLYVPWVSYVWCWLTGVLMPVPSEAALVLVQAYWVSETCHPALRLC